jgi:hypothetical protein
MMKKNNPIKGLLLYTFYSAMGNMALMSGMALLVGCVFLITGQFNYFTAFAIGALIGIPWVPMMNTHKDTASKWNIFQLTTSVKRKDVIAANYLGQFLLLLAGTVLIGIFIGISIIIHGNLHGEIVETAIDYFPIFMGAALLTNALFYPLVYTIGENKEEALSLVSVAIASGISIFIFWIGNKLNLSQIIIALLSLTITIVLFVVSYVITKKIYANKDF